MFISNLVIFIFRSEIVFGILFCVVWNSVCGWEELKLLRLYIMFGMVNGDGFCLKVDSGMELVFVF